MNDELQAFLARHPDLHAVQVYLTDPSGVARGKNLRRDELAAVFEHGRMVAGSILGLDVTGADVEGTGLVWEAGDADRRCLPVPGTLQPMPWQPGMGQLMLTMHEMDGSPCDADPRHALARSIARLQSRGLTPVFACEVEFYLLRRLPDGRVVPAGSDLPTREGQRERIEAYGLGRLDDLAPVFADLFAAADAQGLPLGTLMSEYAPGQFEITLRHHADALRAVDEAIQYKRLVRGVAARHGLIASFMAKPFTQRAGSGAHLHLSLADAEGRNLCAAEDPAGSALLRHMVGGLKATAAEAFLAFAPHGNSFRRFQQQSYAPVSASWGINNRSVSLRIPAGPPASRHVEHRFCGADANLYVAATVVLAGAALGIEQGLDPGPPTSGNGYAGQGVATGITPPDQLPATWPEAIARARGSAFLRDALGEGFHRVYLAIKAQECAAWSAEVTDIDLAWYLRSV